MIAALYVDTRGVYSELGLDVWGGHRERGQLVIDRDARAYAGPSPVIAHPPCERWGRYWSGGPSAKVRRWGGVLEHPEASHAWRAFDLARPPRSGGWIPADDLGGWTCCVAQGKYGHRAQKLTWLYAFGTKPRDLDWGPTPGLVRLDRGYHSAEERRRSAPAERAPRLSSHELAATPRPFAELLIEIATRIERR